MKPSTGASLSAARVAHVNAEAIARTWLPNALVVFGVLLWWLSALGLDPTNVPQAQDLERFHLPSIRTFAERPFLAALSDYPAAPFPLFYVLGGWLYAATHSVLAIKLATIALALGVLACARLLAMGRFPTSRVEPKLLVAATLISPYFRGQSVYANTDVLALLLALLALVVFGERTPRFPSTRAALALTLACCAVYTRQFYVLLPAYLLIRTHAERGLRSSLAAALLCSVLALPAVALVVYWGGLTTPRFAEHATLPSLSASIPAVVLLLAFYAAPLALITAWKFRDRAAAELRRLPLWLWALPAALLAVHALVSDGIPEVVGGGIPLHLLRALPVHGFGRSLVLAMALAGGATYLVYLVAQSPVRNGIVLLVFACFVPTGILYQRYFDPLLPLLWVTVLHTRELPAADGRAGLMAIVAFELVVAATGMLHYRSVFSAQ